MRFYNETHKYTCGIDLHASNLHLCIIDGTGKKLVHRRIPNLEGELLRVIKPYREDMVVSVESTFNWYWLGDLCAREKIPFVLGHAQYMKAIHQGKTKNDRVDSDKITRLTAGKLLPQAHAYSKEMRTVRDLLRRRLYFVRERAALKGHIKIVAMQYNVPLRTPEGRLLHNMEILESLTNINLQESVRCDVQSVLYFDSLVKRIEKHILKCVAVQNQQVFNLISSVRGIGNILGLTILYEMHSLDRFKRVQDFLSYARLVRSEHTSNGQKVGAGGRKIGNPYLKWAFSEAAVHMASVEPKVAELVRILKQRYGTAGAWSRLSMKIARSVYYILKSKQSFNLERFIQDSKRALESSANSLELQGGSHGH